MQLSQKIQQEEETEVEIVGLGLPLQGPGWTENARVLGGACGCAGEERKTLCAFRPFKCTRNGSCSCSWTLTAVIL